jgi:hypothetical protein
MGNAGLCGWADCGAMAMTMTVVVKFEMGAMMSVIAMGNATVAATVAMGREGQKDVGQQAINYRTIKAREE